MPAIPRHIVSRLEEFYAPDEIRTWLHAQHPQLDGRRAIDLIHEGRTSEVLKLIDRLEDEVFL